MKLPFRLLGFVAACSLVSGQPQTGSAGAIEFTASQSAQGKVAYDRSCRQCHGRDLDDGEFAPPLRGTAFLRNWAGKSVAELFTYTSTRMPSDAPGSLGARVYAGIVAYMLQSNNVPSGTREMPSTAAELASMRIPSASQSREAPGGDLRRACHFRVSQRRARCSTI
jgi:alcohol dehydrogenase (cytochrome c)